MQMNKFLGIVVLGLLFINSNSFGSILINNCQTIKEDGTLMKFKDGQRREFFINFNEGYVIYTNVTSDEFSEIAKGINEVAEERGENLNISLERATNKKYIITFADEKLVIAKKLEDADKRGSLIHCPGCQKMTSAERKKVFKYYDDVSYAYYNEIIINLNKNTVEHNYYADTLGGKRTVSFIKSIQKDIYFKGHPFYQCFEVQSETGNETSGTAFFINNKGHLLTNNHVVEGCDQSKIKYFNKEYDAQLISTDNNLDLALLKVNIEPKSFISFSKNKVKKRDVITAAGYPLGIEFKDDLNINDGKVGSLKGLDNNSNHITHNININPGNSGGPIVNQKGELVAVAVSGMSKEITEGLNFGIKSSAVENFLRSNNINPNMGSINFSINNDKVNQLLEESTVYTFCEIK